MAEFHKVTPVKPFIDCLLTICHTTLTWNEWKLVDTLSTIFPYISNEIPRKWQHCYSEYQGVAVYVPRGATKTDRSVFVPSTLLVLLKYAWR